MIFSFSSKLCPNFPDQAPHENLLRPDSQHRGLRSADPRCRDHQLQDHLYPDSLVSFLDVTHVLLL